MCPHCLGQLVLDNSLVLSVAIDESRKGLLFLHPEVGNYSLIKHPRFPLEDGMELEVFCPICHANLRESSVHSNLIKLILVDKDGHESDLFFSGIMGEHSTYKVKDKKVEKYGGDSDNYIDFFNLSQNF